MRFGSLPWVVGEGFWETVWVLGAETRYAKSGDVHVAYQVSGDGPFDVVFVPGFVSHVEIETQIPGRSAFFERLEGFARLYFSRSLDCFGEPARLCRAEAGCREIAMIVEGEEPHPERAPG